jgi:hypothetical protein
MVKWSREISKPFTISQGVRQGGVLSADQYKRYNNTLLDTLEHSNLGGSIGTIPCPAPTCADDVALTASSPIELQALLSVAHQYSCQELLLLFFNFFF